MVPNDKGRIAGAPSGAFNQAPSLGPPAPAPGPPAAPRPWWPIQGADRAGPVRQSRLCGRVLRWQECRQIKGLDALGRPAGSMAGGRGPNCIIFATHGISLASAVEQVQRGRRSYAMVAAAKVAWLCTSRVQAGRPQPKSRCGNNRIRLGCGKLPGGTKTKGCCRQLCGDEN